MITLTKSSDSFYKVPTFYIDNIRDIVAHNEPRIYQLNIGDGMLLHFYVRANVSDGDFIRVTFHGARTAKTSLPYFVRATSSLATPEPFILFSDPTLGLDEGNLLSWFVGTPTVDVDDVMEEVVRHVGRITGTPNAVFEGASGGGFLALRMSARFARSIAVAFSPQTDIFRYIPTFAQRLSENLYFGFDEQSLKATYPGRFNVGDIYAARADRGNLIEYAQNVGDTIHVDRHLQPFLRQLGLPEDAAGGLGGRLSVTSDDLGAGHVPHDIELWDRIATSAMERLREELQDSDLAPLYDEPAYCSDSTRKANLQDYCEKYTATASVSGLICEQYVSAYNNWKIIDESTHGLTVKIGNSDNSSFALIENANASGSIIRVFLHGVVDPKVTRLPVLGKKFAVDDQHAILDVSISDPTLALDSKLRVGWYMGHESWNPLKDISLFIDDLMTISGAKLAVIIAASSAGLAALKLSGMGANRRAIAFCPEVSIQSVVGDFVDVARRLAFPSFDSFSHVPRSKVLPPEFYDLKTKTILLANPTAKHYMQYLDRVNIEYGHEYPDFELRDFIHEVEEIFGQGQTVPNADGSVNVISEACEYWLGGEHDASV